MMLSGSTYGAIVLMLLALLVECQGYHNKEVPLRGYSCKRENVSQKPCQLCPEGYYCSDEYTMHECGGIGVYCPIGSVQPTPVSAGYFTIGGNETTRSAEEKCPPGYYCSGGAKIICEAGYYCPRSHMSAPLECGNSTVYCEIGSKQPRRVEEGFFTVGGTNDTTRTSQELAPKGHYATNGILKPCHEGHFSSLEGKGVCTAGWFCPEGNISSEQIVCGGEDLFCPVGSASPQQVQVGYYTSTEEEPCRPGTYRQWPDDSDVETSPIASSRTIGTCVLCPIGTYKLSSSDDVNHCTACGPRAKSTHDRITCECHQSATERALFELFFEPYERKCLNISDAQPPPDDWYVPNTQLTRSKEMPCEPGHFCQDGIRYRCRGGIYGDKELETNEDCSGPCEEGHWCGEASTSATQNKCGGPNVYCPQGSSTPIYVSEGFYTNEDKPDDMRSSQNLCEPGHYCESGLKIACESGTFGASSGLSDKACNGSCSAGYYCLSGSVSPTQPCGNSTVYCPEGSKLPVLVDEGYYSAMENDIIVADYYAGPNSTQQVQVECEIGYYCTGGIKYSCPEGSYGVITGASDAAECRHCTAGYYCPSYPGPPTTKDTRVPCGDASLFCPEGSASPQHVQVGYYSIPEDGNQQAFAEVICEPGFKCQNGVKTPCSAGTYGETSGLAADDCSELCPRSYFCPEKSVHPLPCSPGSYSTGGAADCIYCDLPLTVPADLVQSMCRDDRSCCLDVFDGVNF